MEVTVTEKGQITLPRLVRERLNLKEGYCVSFAIDADGRVELIPKHGSIRDLKGCLPPPATPVTLQGMEEAIINGACRK